MKMNNNIKIIGDYLDEIFPNPKPASIPIKAKIILSLAIYIVTSESKNPSTLIVDNSRKRSEILILFKLYKTMKDNTPDRRIKIKTTGPNCLDMLVTAAA